MTDVGLGLWLKLGAYLQHVRVKVKIRDLFPISRDLMMMTQTANKSQTLRNGRITFYVRLGLWLGLGSQTLG